MKIVADAHIPYIKDYFGAYGELVLKPGRAISHADVKDADILLVRSITEVNEQLLKNTRVHFVGSVTAGADHLDTAWLDKAGIAWRIAHGFNAPPVADYVVSVIAALQHNALLGKRKLTAAVVGVGHVGRLVVERLQQLQIEVVLCDPLRAQQENNFISTPLDELRDVDLVSLHVPLTRKGSHPTYHMIDKHFLQRQKPGCILLNASRGPVIHSAELWEHGRHLIWCFDVWENEPKINKTILAAAKIATPHIAGYSVQSKIRGVDMIYQAACHAIQLPVQSKSPLDLSQQVLLFGENARAWQDVVLGVFNPVTMTEMMYAALLPNENDGHLFDELRNQFNSRYEFAYTSVQSTLLSIKEKHLLNAMGMKTI